MGENVPIQDILVCRKEIINSRHIGPRLFPKTVLVKVRFWSGKIISCYRLVVASDSILIFDAQPWDQWFRMIDT